MELTIVSQVSNHPSDEDLSPGTPVRDLGYPARGYSV